jgi:hypothetical protein
MPNRQTDPKEVFFQSACLTLHSAFEERRYVNRQKHAGRLEIAQYNMADTHNCIGPHE